ncbi:hypothetical protein A0H81_13373 [Grifola frondosa]|uniref:Uncharacterized protein n=1 Tax=Grifola frondosa TaxID=5627 RepID=A0A1C7LPB7_GRIFR|nr:hypothetical protein A0H81_13373 [Grifola frondosa]
MSAVEAALALLDKEISNLKGKEKTTLAETSAQVSSHLVLLKSSTISEQAVQKLSKCFREHLLRLYSAFLLPSLQFAAAIFERIYHEKVLAALGNQQQEQKILWETVLYALLSGILDLLDSNDNNDVKDAIALALYPTICDICFSLTAPKIAVDLRCSAYNLLSDSTASHKGNQQRLRDPKLLGGERLGAIIWRTKDYLAIESLLNLFARVLPSTNNSASGRTQRTAFIQSVFVSPTTPEVTVMGQEVAALLEHVPTRDWEETASKIVDVLGRGNIAYPQPFAGVDVSICRRPQSSDRLYVDDKAFLVNIILGDDECESIEIPYSTVRKIEIDHERCDPKDQNAVIRIIIQLSSPPMFGKYPIQEKTGDGGDNTVPTAVFVLNKDHERRFTEALRSRNLSRFIRMIVPPKLSLATSPTALNFDSQGNPIKELSQNERIQNVAQFYRTDDTSDDFSFAQDLEEACVRRNGSSPSHFLEQKLDISSSNIKIQKTIPLKASKPYARSPCKMSLRSRRDTLNLPIDEIKPSTVVRTASLVRSGTQVVRDAAFGTSDEELSEISDWESDAGTTRASKPMTSGKVSSGKTDTSMLVPHSRRVLDSDDDAPGLTRYNQSRTRNAKKKAVLERDSSGDQNGDGLRLDLDTLATKPQPISMTPITPPSQTGADSTMVHNSAVMKPPPKLNEKTKALRFNMQDEGLKVISPVNDSPSGTTAAGSSPSALVSKNTTNLTCVDVPMLSKSSKNTSAMPTFGSILSRSAHIQVNSEAPVKKAHLDPIRDRLPDPASAPLHSSPTPSTRGTRKSIKDSLRKKNQSAAEDVTEQNHMKASKRRKDEENDNDPSFAFPDDFEGVRPSKRRRASSDVKAEADHAVPLEQTESQVLRPRTTAATRAKKKYRGKKGRTSSPIVAGHAVDYDSLPSPPHVCHLSAPPPPKKRMGKLDKGAALIESSPAVTRTARAAAAKKENVPAPVVPPLVQVDPPAQNQNEQDAPPARPRPRAKTVQRNEKVLPVDEHAQDVVDAVSNNLPTVAARPLTRRAKALGIKPAAVDEPAEGGVIKRVAAAPGKLSDRSIKKSHKAPWDNSAFAETARPADADTNERESQDNAMQNALYHLAADELSPIGAVQGVLSRITPLLPIGVMAPLKSPQALDLPIPRPPPPVNVLPTSPPVTEPSRQESPPLPNDGLELYTRPALGEEPESASTSRMIVVKEAAQDMQKTELPAKTPLVRKMAMSSSRVDSGSADTQLNKTETTVPLKEGYIIDLTQDDSPVKRQPSAVRIQPSHVSPVRSRSASVVDIAESPSPTLKRSYLTAVHPSSASRPRYSVTFAPIVEERQPSPPAFHPMVASSPKEWTSPHVTKPTNFAPPAKRIAYQRRILKSEEDRARQLKGDDDEGNSMQAIVDVLGQIQQAILRKITTKFEGVRSEVREGQEALLSEAMADMHQMRAESVTHFNRLVDLEAEYANLGRKISNGFEDMVKINQDLYGNLAGVVEDHDRNMLSKKMPTSLFSSG